jgi:hypothetical protein
MYQKEQYTSLGYNQTRERYPRPQTPGAGSNPFNIETNNRSSTKIQPSGYSPHKYHLQNNYYRNANISKSRISVSSSNSQLSFLNTDQGEIFP